MRSLPRLLVLPALLLALVAFAACGESGAEEPTPAVDSGGESLRQDVHWHADFALVIEGEMFDFSDAEYVSDVDEEIHEYLHIHPERYSVVHVHREASTWREFFGTFGWTLSDTYLEFEDGTRIENDGENTWKFFVNGVRVDSVMFLDISDLQRTLIVYGPETPEEALEMYWPQVTDQACVVSGSCADRIDPNEPPEPCSGRGSCVG